MLENKNILLFASSFFFKSLKNYLKDKGTFTKENLMMRSFFSKGGIEVLKSLRHG